LKRPDLFSTQLSSHAGNQLRQDDIAAWRLQSSWLLLKPGNVPARQIGKLWINFVLENTGRKTNLRVWRKVAETTSSKQNSFEKQQALSGALLHQHKTGQEYYVTHNPREKSQEVHQVWNALMSTSQSSQQLQVQEKQPLTATQAFYQYRPGDWRGGTYWRAEERLICALDVINRTQTQEAAAATATTTTTTTTTTTATPLDNSSLSRASHNTTAARACLHNCAHFC